MGWRQRYCLGLLVATALGIHAAWSQTPPPPPPSTTAPTAPAARFLLNMMRNGVTLEQYMKTANERFAQLDADSDGKITGADDQLNALMSATSMRSGMLMGLLAADLDGDGIVTVDELRRYFAYQRRANIVRQPNQTVGHDQQTETVIAEFMKADADKDGKITVAEMLAWANGLQQQQRSSGLLTSRNFDQVSSFDSDADGTVSRQEFDAAHEAFFRTMDTDGDGTISAEELKNYRAQLAEPSAAARRDAREAAKGRDAGRQAENAARAEREQKQQAVMAEQARRQEEERAACAMPKASSSAKVVLISGYEADALSTTTLGSQDVVIHAGTITIEPGSEPLYLAVSTHDATIWQLTGATDRIERLVLATGTTLKKDGTSVPLVGATGVPADKVTMLRGGDCVRYFNEVPSINAASASGKVSEDIGKPVDLLIGRYRLGNVSLPSGAVREDDKTKSSLLVIQKSVGSLTTVGNPKGIVVRSASVDSLAEDLARYSPGGVVAIEPASVVSIAPAQPYQILPQEAGLLQVLQNGALTRNRSGEYLIREKIRFPAGLAGAHSVKFLLLKDVPEPDGDPSHSQVFSEATGQIFKRK